MHGEEFKVKLVSMGLCVDGGKDTSHKRRWEIDSIRVGDLLGEYNERRGQESKKCKQRVFTKTEQGI